jgi:hypothetical protein
VAAPSFRGFLIQARLVADDTTVAGQFEEPPAGGEYRYGSCSNREVANTTFSHYYNSQKLNATHFNKINVVWCWGP